MKTNQLVRPFLLGIFILLASQLYAREAFSIKGHVLNTKTESIKGTIVTLRDPNSLVAVANGRCDRNGEFFIDSVLEGEYILTVKKDGRFRGKTKRIFIDGNGNYAVKNIHQQDSIQPEGKLVASGK